MKPGVPSFGYTKRGDGRGVLRTGTSGGLSARTRGETPCVGRPEEVKRFDPVEVSSFQGPFLKSSGRVRVVARPALHRSIPSEQVRLYAHVPTCQAHRLFLATPQLDRPRPVDPADHEDHGFSPCGLCVWGTAVVLAVDQNARRGRGDRPRPRPPSAQGHDRAKTDRPSAIKRPRRTPEKAIRALVEGGRGGLPEAGAHPRSRAGATARKIRGSFKDRKPGDWRSGGQAAAAAEETRVRPRPSVEAIRHVADRLLEPTQTDLADLADLARQELRGNPRRSWTERSFFQIRHA